MEISADGIAFIKQFEGFMPKLYNDTGNNCTVGYGHLVHMGPCNGRSAEEFEYLKGITEAQAADLLRRDVVQYVNWTQRAVKVAVSQAQFDALVSFCYNCGPGALEKLIAMSGLNTGNYDGVPAELEKYVRDTRGQIQPGLVRRRAREVALWRSPVPQAITAGDCAWIYGVHDAYPREWFDGSQRKGWVLHTCLPGDKPVFDFGPWAAAGFGTICRVNNDYGGEGTIPLAPKHDSFAAAVAQRVSQSAGCLYWIIGNEPNAHGWERAAQYGDITPQEFATVYVKCKRAIKAVAPHVRVIPGAVGPYAVHLNLMPHEWFAAMLAEIERQGEQPDGFALHGYRNIDSGYFADDPLKSNGYFYGLRTIEQQRGWIPERYKTRPILVTEMNPGADKAWTDDGAWVQQAYDYIHSLNQQPNAQQIHCALLFRYAQHDATFSIANKPNVIRGLQRIVAATDYRRKPNPQAQTVSVYMPAVSQLGAGADVYRADCGQAAVLARLRSLGIGAKNTVDELARQVGGDYTSAGELVQLFERWGVAADEVRNEAQALRFGDVVLIRYGQISQRIDKGYSGLHWVVFVKRLGKEVVVHDPDMRGSLGYGRRYWAAEFDAAYAGVCVRTVAGYVGEATQRGKVGSGGGKFKTVRLRSTPEFDKANEVGELAVGTPVAVIVRDGRWALLDLGEGKAAYMYEALIEFDVIKD